jgi:hypothetical protein
MKITEIISESKQSKDALKPRNFVAKNAINTGAGQHKDKKRAEKQGDVKHKRQAVPMDEQSVSEVAGAQKCWPGHKKVGTQPGTGKNKGKRVNDCEKIEEDETRMSRAAKGHEKYGKKGMQALAKAGRNNASEKTLDSIRDKHNKYDESATMGATSAANVSIGPAYKNKPAKTPKNKDGTAKNALDINANLITGGSIKR